MPPSRRPQESRALKCFLHSVPSAYSRARHTASAEYILRREGTTVDINTAQDVFFVLPQRPPHPNWGLQASVSWGLTEEREEQTGCRGWGGGAPRLGLPGCHLGRGGERGAAPPRPGRLMDCPAVRRSLALPTLSAGAGPADPLATRRRQAHPAAPGGRPAPALPQKLPVASRALLRSTGRRAVPVQAGAASSGPGEGAVVHADAGVPSSWGEPDSPCVGSPITQRGPTLFPSRTNTSPCLSPCTSRTRARTWAAQA